MSVERTVHVVESDPSGRKSVVKLAAKKGLEVQSYTSAEQFLECHNSSVEGCLVVCAELDGMSGLELQRHLSDAGDSIPVIVVAASGDIPMAVSAMSAGAINFLEKPYDESELWESIEFAIAKDKSHRHFEQERAKIRNRIAQLSDGEKAVLRCMIAGLLNKQTKDVLDIGLRTVELRRASIMQKLQASSLADIVRMAVIAEVEPHGKVKQSDSGTT